MANTPPKPPIHKRSDLDLLEDLSIELRHVGVCDYDSPSDNRFRQHVNEVCLIHSELVRRKVDATPRIDILSKETAWKMQDLLEDCLAHPKRRPYAKELDGIRKALRCHMCRNAERPPDAKLFWFCESCMKRVALALNQRIACEGIVIFRSYTPNSRCSHADADTPLAAEWYSEQIYGFCEKCVLEEMERRKELPSIQ